MTAPYCQSSPAGAHIPLTILIMTRNETKKIEPCLKAIANFAPVVIVDTGGDPAMQKMAEKYGARFVAYEWNGRYPKKRQWALEALELDHNWILFIDADERIPQKLKTEITTLFATKPEKDGYFIPSVYKINTQICRFGLRNNKLVLFDRTRLAFPVVDDLKCPGMGEIEGHYQPVSRNFPAPVTIGRLKNPMVHLAFEDEEKWYERHNQYARWAACMTSRKSWPVDPVPWRQKLKECSRVLLPVMPFIAFAHSYILKAGFIDGQAGLKLAKSRYYYYKKIRECGRALV